MPEPTTSKGVGEKKAVTCERGDDTFLFLLRETFQYLRGLAVVADGTSIEGINENSIRIQQRIFFPCIFSLFSDINIATRQQFCMHNFYFPDYKPRIYFLEIYVHVNKR
jgi:hypothetical protein